MKKSILVITFIIFSVSAKTQSLNVGIYGSLYGEDGIHIEDNRSLRFDSSPITLAFGVVGTFDFDGIVSAEFNIGWLPRNITLFDVSGIDNFFYHAIPISIATRTSMLRIYDFSIYIKNGFFGAYCYNHSYSAIYSSPLHNVEGIIGDFSMKRAFSFGVVNGFGADYIFKSNIGIGFYIDYYLGLNTVWENSNIFISQNGGVVSSYTASSNGSGLQMGLSLFYRLNFNSWDNY